MELTRMDMAKAAFEGYKACHSNKLKDECELNGALRRAWMIGYNKAKEEQNPLK